MPICMNDRYGNLEIKPTTMEKRFKQILDSKNSLIGSIEVYNDSNKNPENFKLNISDCARYFGVENKIIASPEEKIIFDRNCDYSSGDTIFQIGKGSEEEERLIFAKLLIIYLLLEEKNKEIGLSNKEVTYSKFMEIFSEKKLFNELMLELLVPENLFNFEYFKTLRGVLRGLYYSEILESEVTGWGNSSIAKKFGIPTEVIKNKLETDKYPNFRNAVKKVESGGTIKGKYISPYSPVITSGSKSPKVFMITYVDGEKNNTTHAKQIKDI